MLWYKAWLETRWRFTAAMFLSAALGVLVVLVQPSVEGLQVDVSQLGEPFREMARQALALAATYEGYVWSQWFGKQLPNVWTFFAVIVGVGGVVTESARGAALWTLALPVTRARLLGVRAAVGALELLAVAVVPSLLIPALSPAIGRSYSAADALAYSLMVYAGGLVFYALSLLLSTVFAEVLKPVIIGLGVAFALSIASAFSRRVAAYSVYGVMSGEKYFREGTVPWAGLAVCVALAAAMFLLALRTLERRDF